MTLPHTSTISPWTYPSLRITFFLSFSLEESRVEEEKHTGTQTQLPPLLDPPFRVFLRRHNSQQNSRAMELKTMQPTSSDSPEVDPPHQPATARILRYLKKFLGAGLLFEKHGHLKVEVYTDVGWAGAVDDRKSTNGYCTFVRGNLITWRSKKQSVVAKSSAEVEYRAVS
ncbi:PREDICTED: uncharacterized protein LOC104596281 [Nelumbo nucifera]|uniref:Uncharacterized protein LOC104596281 n=1 Tax=Nelumbo nucifera TaxID=4432 RepID=A0A1U7ZQH0_NELNU|nr:PREDICTED: uncharacterized protein LOC104596281 [Nelumbo nucifera]